MNERDRDLLRLYFSGIVLAIAVALLVFLTLTLT